MLQAIVRKGRVIAEQVPEPVIEKGYLKIKVINSCISAGTEVSSVKASGKSLIKRISESPQEIARAVEVLKSKGLQNLLTKVDQLQSGGKVIGYSISGIVTEVGEGVSGFKAGDRVAGAGAGFANHAEYAKIPANLVVKIPDEVSFIDASTSTIGAIALQGVRRANLKFGEFAVVLGAGILGLITLQILTSSGVRVAVIDIDSTRISRARDLGAEIIINPEESDPVKIIGSWTNGYGADAVIFTAATSSSEPLSSSFKMCRRKGYVVLVGVSGMEIQRSDMYLKELDLKISTSYGPGRYDDCYEIDGIDYPYAYVRWTENRNMQEYLRLIQTNKINIATLIDNHYMINDVDKAFLELNDHEKKPLIIILDYDHRITAKTPHTVYLQSIPALSSSSAISGRKVINIALVGTGNFATGTHIPVIKSLEDKFKLYCVMNRTGHKAKFVAEQNNAVYATTEIENVLGDKNVDLILITTRHDSHAEYVVKSLKAGKHVFVEKPLAINSQQLDEISGLMEGNKGELLLHTGFNRRFSPYITELKKFTDARINPLFINYRMNAGYVPLDNWIHESGGRMVGELCHIIDLMIFLTGSRVESVFSESIKPATGKYSASDNKLISLRFTDGSLANITYFAVGNKSFPKEYMEIHYDENTIVMDNFQKLVGYGLRMKKIETKTPSKGIYEEYLEIYKALNSDKLYSPIPFDEQRHTTYITFLV